MPRIRELLTAFRRMPPTVIAERISWPFSIRTSSDRVAELRAAYLPADPASRTPMRYDRTRRPRQDQLPTGPAG